MWFSFVWFFYLVLVEISGKQMKQDSGIFPVLLLEFPVDEQPTESGLWFSRSGKVLNFRTSPIGHIGV